MEQNKLISVPQNRITVVDALRGFALLGVLIVHMMQHYGIFSFGGPPSEALFPQTDGVIQWLMRNVLMGKFINIFAFLFGLSFFIQMDRAAKKGIDFRRRFLWRMALLFVIGMIGNCFYTGDILSIYALFGVLMVFLYKAKGWVLMVIVSLLLLGLPRILTTGYDRMTRVEQTAETVQGQTSEERPAVRQQAPAPEKPSFFNSAKRNLTTGMKGKLNYQFGMFGRGYITFAMFILGLLAGRARFFEEVHIRRRRNVILLAGFVLAVLVMDQVIGLFPASPGFRAMSGGAGVPASLLASMALGDIRSVLFSGALAMGFIALYQTRWGGKCLDVITPYGRMGLTNYEAQAVIGSVIFSAWGFGSVFGGWGATELFLLAIVIYAAQVVISRYWLKYYLYGPLEWLWRTGTYLKRQPFRCVK